MTIFNEKELELIKSLGGGRRYNSKMFSDIPMEQRDDLYAFLCCETSIQAMVTATYFKKPAIPALSDKLIERFGKDFVTKPRVKMYCGMITKHNMTVLGYLVDKVDVIVTVKNNIFTCATRYKKG